MNPENPCTEPTFVKDPNGEDRWHNQHIKFIRQSLDLDPEVIFIGDSIIQYMQLTPIWMKWFVPMHALNFGIGGDCTQNVLWRVVKGELDYCKPKVVVILVGTNNVSNTPEQIADGIISIAEVVREKLPDAHIVLLSLLPRGKEPNANRTRNEKVNKIVKVKATTVSKCQFLTIGAGLLQMNRENDEIIDHHDMFDYLHLTCTGYEKVFEPVYELLTQLLQENEPEPDLDKILQS